MNAARLSVLENAMTSAPGLAAIALLAASPAAFAGPGDLDATFGEGGRVFVDTPGDIDVAATVILQADGKLVIGRANEAADDDFSVLRFNVDGSPDMGFGGDGRTGLDYPGIKGTTRFVLQLSDGKILAAGTAQNTLGSDGTNFGMARYNGDGSVDTGFGVDGVVIHDPGGQSDGINAIIQQADGRLVAAGYTYGGVGSDTDMAFAGFNADGSLDASFGANGSVVINFHEANGPDEVRGLIQQADGKLIAVGTAWPSNPTNSGDIGIVRLSQDGIPDTTFGADGRVAINLAGISLNPGSYFLDAAAVALQSDGRIVLAGTTDYTVWDYGGCLPMLLRLNTDGSLDTSFGGIGAVPILVDSCAAFDGVAVEPNGDLYFAGALYSTGNADLFAARVTASGNLDTSYGANGVAIVDLGNANHAASVWYGSLGIIRQPDGKIVTVATNDLGGWWDYGGESGDAELVIARLLADGDHAGVLGFRGLTQVSDESSVAEIPVRRTGGFSGTVSVDYETASGSATSGTDFTATAGTLTWADGESSDKTISISIADDTQTEGSEGFQVILSNPSGGASLATTEMTFEIQDDENSGSESPPPAGPPANSGGSGGGAVGLEFLFFLTILLVASLPPPKQRFRAVFLLVGISGGIVAAGGNALADGDLDPTFGNGGLVYLDPGGTNSHAHAVMQQVDGKLVLGGWIDGHDDTTQLFLARFEADGTLDAEFGAGGIVYGTGTEEAAAAVMQQTDGKIVVAGGRGLQAPDNPFFSDFEDISLWRFNADGTADTGFGIGGRAVLDIGSTEHGASLVQQADGRLVVAATVNGAIRVLRLNGNGSLDATFGAGGTLIVPGTGVPDSAYALLQQPDGKLLVAGDRYDPEGYVGGHVLVARATADGNLDGSFGAGGVVQVDLDFESWEGCCPGTWDTSSALQDDGKIVVSGSVGAAGHRTGFVLRLDPDGALDPAFGDEGLVLDLRLDSDWSVFVPMTSVGIEPDGQIVVALGCSGFFSCQMAIARFNPDGDLDTSFGLGGVAQANFTSPGGHLYADIGAMIRQAEGNYVVVGSHTLAVPNDRSTVAMARFAEGNTMFAGRLGLSTESVAADEDSGPVTLLVRRTGGSAGAVSVMFETANGTALAGTDYIAESGQLHWSDGDTSDQPITVTLVDDMNADEAEQEHFTLHLSATTAGAMLGTSVATVSILDDESAIAPPPTPTPLPIPSGGGGSDWSLIALLVCGLGMLSGSKRRKRAEEFRKLRFRPRNFHSDGGDAWKADGR